MALVVYAITRLKRKDFPILIESASQHDLRQSVYDKFALCLLLNEILNQKKNGLKCQVGGFLYNAFEISSHLRYLHFEISLVVS